MMAAKRYRPHKPKPKPRVSLAIVGYDGRFELGSRVVDDPFPDADGRRAKVTVAANVKADVLVMMQAKGVIDDAQSTAGMRFRSLYEHAEIGGARGVDHARPVVDGGCGVQSGASAVAADAIREMAEIRRTVGDAPTHILVALIGEGVTITDYATRLNGGHPSSLMRDNVSCMLRAALDGLIAYWGVGGTRQPRPGR
jgi:hypothetical protein